MKTTYPALIIHALELASRWHDGQFRKHATQRTPYIAHPAAVGLMLYGLGYDEEIVAAGILHDVIEDCDVSFDEVAAATSFRVAELVDWVSERKDLPWKERKELYCQRLEKAPEGALAICAADHTYNLNSILSALKDHLDVWSWFNASREQKLVQEQAVVEVLRKRLDSPLVLWYEEALQDCINTN